MKTPGSFPISGPTTLLQAIAMAGNVTEFGNRRRVRISREVNGKYYTQSVDMVKVTGTKAIFVHPGDVIEVPEY